MLQNIEMSLERHDRNALLKIDIKSMRNKMQNGVSLLTIYG